MASTSNTTPNPKPNYSQSSNKSLWVGGLDKWMTEAYLKEIFTASTNTRIFHHSASGFGFIEFDSHEMASKALLSSTGATMPKSDRQFKINWATQPTASKKVSEPPASKVSSERSNKSSWANRLTISDSTSRCSLSEVKTIVVDDVLIILDDVISEGYREWARCMVGYFPSYTMPFHAARNIAFRAWKSNGLEEVTSSGTSFFIFRFQTEEAIHSILGRGPWMFGGRTIILKQWHAEMSFDKRRI